MTYLSHDGTLRLGTISLGRGCLTLATQWDGHTIRVLAQQTHPSVQQAQVTIERWLKQYQAHKLRRIER